MTDPYKPKNTPSLTPYLVVRDAEKAMNFYQKAFGFETSNVAHDDNNRPMHVEMRKGEALIMFCYEGAFGNQHKAPVTQGITMPLNLYIYCENTDALYEKAIKEGAISQTAPNDGFWGDRFCTVLDPDGYEWSFATYLGETTITKH